MHAEKKKKKKKNLVVPQLDLKVAEEGLDGDESESRILFKFNSDWIILKISWSNFLTSIWLNKIRSMKRENM